MPVVLGHKDRRVRPDLVDRRAIPAQLVKWDLRDPKVRRVKQDLRDRRAIRVKLVKRDPKARKDPTVSRDPKAFRAQLGRLLNRPSALLPVQTAQLRAMKMRFWFLSSARRGRLMVRHVRREARRQACACGSKPDC